MSDRLYVGAELTVQPRYTTALDRLDRGETIETFRRHNLVCSLVCRYGGVVGEDEQRAAAAAALRETIDLAADLAPIGPGGAPPPVTTTSGGKPEEWDQAKSRIADDIGALVEHAARRGVPFAMKAHAANALARPHQLIWLLEQIDSPALGFNVDMSHFEANGLTIHQAIPALMPHASHVHVKASRGRYPDQEYMIPGEGQSDFPALFRAIRASGYDGYLSVEISVHVQRRPGYDPLAALTTSYIVLSAALDAAGVARDRAPNRGR